LFKAPADETIAILEMKGRRAPGGYRQPLALVGGHVAQLLAYQRGLVQVVVFDNKIITPSCVFV